jgi:hypothetical protein
VHAAQEVKQSITGVQIQPKVPHMQFMAEEQQLLKNLLPQKLLTEIAFTIWQEMYGSGAMTGMGITREQYKITPLVP